MKPTTNPINKSDKRPIPMKAITGKTIFIGSPKDSLGNMNWYVKNAPNNPPRIKTIILINFLPRNVRRRPSKINNIPLIGAGSKFN